MKKIAVGFSIVVLLSGCASAPANNPPKEDKEPVLVGLPMKEKVTMASKDIKNQMDLLNKVSHNQYVGSYKLVTHNNNLDARAGSSNTLPAAAARKGQATTTTLIAANNEPQSQSNVLVNNSEKTIKQISWKNGSLNDLVRNFSNAKGYKFVNVSKNKDRTVSFYVENETISNALNRLKEEVSSFALITVDENVKTVYLNFN